MALVCPSLEEARGSLTRAVATARERLAQATAIGSTLGVPTHCLLRLDEDIAGGMSRSALEQGADLLLIGTGQPDKLRQWLFGDLVDGVCRSAHCPVVVVNLAGRDPEELQRILVPIKDLSASAREQFELAQRLLNHGGGGASGVITLLPVGLVQSSGDHLLRQIVRQVSRKLTWKVQEDFHSSQGLECPPRRQSQF